MTKTKYFCHSEGTGKQKFSLKTVLFENIGKFIIFGHGGAHL